MKPKKPIESLILTLRGQKVILDADLAELYGVPTKRLNEQVKRNADRFPEDFCFQLTDGEWTLLKSKMTASSAEDAQKEGITPNWSQIVTASKRNIRERSTGGSVFRFNILFILLILSKSAGRG
jgi:hypothetical protein